MKSITYTVITLLATLAAAPAFADVIPYPNIGTVAATPTLTASITGAAGIYFAGYSAADTDFVDVCDVRTSVCTGNIFQNNTTAEGSEATLAVTAGDAIELFVFNQTLNQTFSSNPAHSPDGINHFYATPYTGSPAVFPNIPNGVYAGAEDLPKSSSDLDYNDEQVVLTGISLQQTPEPSSTSLLALGAVSIVIARRFRRVRNAG